MDVLKLNRYHLPDVIFSQRCVLRPVRKPADFDALSNYFNDNDQDYPRTNLRWAYSPIPYDRQYVRLIDGQSKAYNIRDYYIFPKGANRIIGSFSFYTDTVNDLRTGYYIRPQERRKGYAAECHEALVKQVFKLNKTLQQIWEETYPENTGSRAVLRSTGFKQRPMRESRAQGVERRCVPHLLHRSSLDL